MFPFGGWARKSWSRRKVEEAKKKGGKGGDDLDDVDPEVEVDGGKGKKRARDEDGEGEDGGEPEAELDGYYELVKKAKKKAKVEKKAAYEAEVASNKYVLVLFAHLLPTNLSS